MSFRRFTIVPIVSALLVVVWAGSASAHVTVAPDSAQQGASDIEITFRVPNEEAAASTTKLEVAIPSDPPLLNAQAQSVPGWTASIMTTHLAKPIHTDDGDFSEVVSQVTWTADSSTDGIKPGDFAKFEILVGTLPSTGDQIVFKALQTYSNGDVVRWIDPVPANGPEPDHPTPILQLTPATDASTSPTTIGSTAAATTTGLAKKSDVDSARTTGIIGIVVGALGLVAAGAALATRRRKAAA